MSRSFARAWVLVAALTFSAPVTAQPPTLNGDWLGFSATGMLLGIHVSAYEHLSVKGGQAVQRAWAFPVTEQGCTSTPDDPPACAPPIPLGAARIEPTGTRLSVTAQGPQIAPFSGSIDAEIWPTVALAGHDWAISGDDRRVVLTREAVVFDEAVTLERIYYRARPQTAGQLYDYLRAIQSSAGQAVCAVEALHAEPDLWAEFEARLAALAPVTAELRRLGDIWQRSREQHLRYLTLNRGPDIAGDLAADLSDLPESARAAWLSLAATLPPAAAPSSPGLRRLDVLALDTRPDIAERAEGCIAHFFSR